MIEVKGGYMCLHCGKHLMELVKEVNYYLDRDWNKICADCAQFDSRDGARFVVEKSRGLLVQINDKGFPL